MFPTITAANTCVWVAQSVSLSYLPRTGSTNLLCIGSLRKKKRSPDFHDSVNCSIWKISKGVCPNTSILKSVQTLEDFSFHYNMNITEVEDEVIRIIIIYLIGSPWADLESLFP